MKTKLTLTIQKRVVAMARRYSKRTIKDEAQLVLGECSLANLFYLTLDIYKIENGIARLSELIGTCSILHFVYCDFVPACVQELCRPQSTEPTCPIQTPARCPTCLTL